MFDLLKFLKLHFKKQTAFEISMGRQLGFWASRPPLQHFGVFLVLKMIMIILWFWSFRWFWWLLWLHCILGFSSSGDVVIDELAPGDEEQGDRMVVVTLVLIIFIISMRMRMMTERKIGMVWWGVGWAPYACLMKAFSDLGVADLMIMMIIVIIMNTHMSWWWSL